GKFLKPPKLRVKNVGKTFIVYGKDELSGFRAGVRLFDMRFFGERVLEGGFQAWKDKGFPVEK
ncbi:MAG: hypothetical protein ABI747_04645, partial [Candidatus Moraniibacteriota bacterium]